MTVTIVGQQGTISDVQMATQAPPLAPIVFTRNDRGVVAVAGQRQVSVAAGSTVSGFMKRTSDQAEIVNLAPPSSGGKWYAISENRQWSPLNSAALQADDLAVATDGTAPNFPSLAAFQAAANLPNQPGSAGSTAGQRQILALVHVRAADTTVSYFDTRLVPGGSGHLVALSLAALLLANLRHLTDGALISVSRHTAPSGGTHITSRWVRESSYLVPAGIIEAEGANASIAQSVAEDIKNLSTLAMATFALPGVADTRFMNRTNKAEYAWVNGNWRLWNQTLVPIEAYGYYIGGASGIADGSTTLSVANGVVTFTLAVFKSGGMGLDAGYFKLIDPFIPPGIYRTAGYSMYQGNNRGTMAARVDNGGNVAFDGNFGNPLDRWYGTFSWPIAV